MVGSDWSGYLGRFHERRPGITERVLGRSSDSGQSPYEWLAGGVGDGPVVDVACGSAPLRNLVGELEYLGFDSSEAELRVARERGAAVALARAEALPLAGASAGTVVCSMALQVIEGIDAAVGETARVLRPGGRLVALVPVTGPVRLRDWPLLSGMVGALGRSPEYPNAASLREPSRLFARAGLTLVSDQRRRFGYRFAERADVDAFLASMYLPGVSRRRLRAARRWLRAWRRAGAEVPVPMRRLIAVR
ncbi:class I SAM-dependent methyltransferase [Glycomyces tarimensis]